MTSLLVALAVLTAQAAPADPKLPRKPAAQPPAEAPAAAPPAAQGAPPAPASEPVDLAGAEDARRVCGALASADRLSFSGTALERGEAEARHVEERERALGGRYRVTVPAARLRFAAYSPEEQVLSLYRHQPPVTADGALRLDPVEEQGLPVEADPAAVKRLLAAQREGKLALRVTFVLPEDEDAGCFHVPGAAAYTIPAEPVAWEYVADGAVLARGGQGADRPLVSAKAGARPRVRLGTALDDAQGKELRLAVEGRVGDLEGCYRTALDRDPFLDGAIVADLQPGRGAPEKVRIAADSVGDEGLVTCVRDVLARLDLRSAGGRAWLPIHFALDPPAEGGAAGQ